MNTDLKSTFLNLWKKYFGNAELPIVFYYTECDGGAEWAEKQKGRSCLICELAKVRSGMFDPSARPCVPENVLTFSVPMLRFEKMIGYTEESFLITPTWSTLKKRIVKRK